MIGIIIQARMGSTRLPSKVMKPLPHGSKSTLIGQIINRSLKAISVDKVVLATSEKIANKSLVDHVTNNFPDIKVFIGSEDNVLDRYYQAAKIHGIQHIVRLTGDNPCIDPAIIDTTVKDHLSQKADYTYSKGYPLGMNVEVISFKALEKAHFEAVAVADCEHVTAFVRNRPSIFKLNFKSASTDYSHWRLTVDTEEDYTLICIVFDELYKVNPCFDFSLLQQLFTKKPYLLKVNKHIMQKKLFDNIQDEVNAAIDILHNLDLNRAAEKLADG